jgi:hypothetical protein
VAGCSVGLGDPPPYLFNPPPKSHRQSTKTKQTLARASRLFQFNPSFILPTSVTHNAPLHAHCQRIPVVVASVAEVEYAAAFGGEQVLVVLTLTLTNLGHPQQSPPLLFVDNECAIGLATSSVCTKKSKSIDMRLEGERQPTILPSCISPWPHQSCRLIYQNPSRLPTHCCPTLPLWHPIPYLFCNTPPPPHTPSSPSLQSSRCSLRQGLPYHSLPLTSPHLFLLSLSLMFSRIASNTPMLFPCSFPILKQGNQRTRQPRKYRRMLVLKLLLSCTILGYSLA